MPLQRFREALNNVPPQYFGETERLFTYELYYQLKEIFNNHPLLNNNIVIDAELPKRRLTLYQARVLGLLPLDKLMSPDFIIHERDTGDNQLLVAEVKAEKYLSLDKTIKDINKLISLRQNYAFQKGVFVAININIQKIKDYIHGLNSNPQQNDPRIMWPVNVPHNNVNIHIFTKEDATSQWEHETLINIINHPPHNP